MGEYLRRESGTLAKNATRIFSKRRLELLLIDSMIIFFCYKLVSFMSDMSIGSIHMDGDFTVKKFFMLFTCIMIIRFLLCIYNSLWRYANTKTYLKIMISDTVGGSFFVLIGREYNEFSIGFAYSVVAVMLIMMTTLASRFTYQYLYASMKRAKKEKEHRQEMKAQGRDLNKINVAIVGAGNMGATLADELIRNPGAHYKPYCFIDKDTNKIGSVVNGIMVYAADDLVIEKIKKMPVQEIAIAITGVTPDEKLSLFNFYKETGCKVKLYDYPLGDRLGELNKESGRRSLREIHIEDLLFRDPLKVNSKVTEGYYRGKTVLVTGGGGSIGSELCRQIAALEPKKLVILDIYENNAYEIQQELVRKYGEKLNLETVIASIRDMKRLDEIFDEVRPEVVFHAAAHKHVPLMEHSGCEAIKNNVFGTYNVANVSEKYGVKKFLLVSTDKAVNPTNIMGASKRLCEMIIQCRQNSKTEFTAVRFGNVLGSNGSVIPLFKKQIEAGGPVTITDKRIIRYFMTIPEAVGLVMEAAAMAKNGELFVLDMGKPVKILDLAENMIRLSGYKPYEDIAIEEIGLRPGEKLYEELIMKTEEMDKTPNNMIFIERDKPYTREQVEEKLSILREAIDNTISDSGHHDAVIKAIKRTVPTYRSPEEVNKVAAESQEMKQVHTQEHREDKEVDVYVFNPQKQVLNNAMNA